MTASGKRRGGRRAAVTTGVVAMLLVALSACVIESDYSGATDGQRVAILGTGVVGEAAGALHAELDAEHAVRLIGVGSTVAGLSSHADTLATTDPVVVVLELGTIDAMQAVPADTTLADIDTTLAKFPAACRVLVNVNTAVASEGFDPTAAATINDGLATRTQHLVDWNAAVAVDVDGMTVGPEHLTPSAAGQVVLADRIAEQVASCTPPVQLGSPYQSFGNNLSPTCTTPWACPTDANGHPQPFLWGSINGPYRSHQDGDPFATRCWADSAGENSCGTTFNNAKNYPTGHDFDPPPPNPGGLGKWNAAYDPGGYLYAVDVKVAGSYTLQVYDAACNEGGRTTDQACTNDTPTDFVLYNGASSRDLVNAVPGNELAGCRTTAAPTETSYRNAWFTLCTVTLTPGIYALRVHTDDIAPEPANQGGFPGCTFTDVMTPDGCVGNGINSFALRVNYAAGLRAELYPLDYLSIFNETANTSSFLLADVERGHAGRNLVVDMYDPGDGNSGDNYVVHVRGPNPTTGYPGTGTPLVPGCTWARSDVQGGAPNLSGASATCDILTRTTSFPPYSRFNNQWVRIVIPIPDDYRCPPADTTTHCWWRVDYAFPVDAAPSDRTVWAVTVTDDPPASP